MSEERGKNYPPYHARVFFERLKLNVLDIKTSHETHELSGLKNSGNFQVLIFESDFLNSKKYQLLVAHA